MSPCLLLSSTVPLDLPLVPVRTRFFNPTKHVFIPSPLYGEAYQKCHFPSPPLSLYWKQRRRCLKFCMDKQCFFPSLFIVPVWKARRINGIRHGSWIVYNDLLHSRNPGGNRRAESRLGASKRERGGQGGERAEPRQIFLR